MSLIRDLKNSYSLAGVRGMLAMSSFHVLAFPKEIAARPLGFASPLQIRLLTSDSATYWEIINGEYAFDLPFRPKVILDAGANIGIASIYFANKFPEAKIFAIEAEASNFEILVRNVRRYPSIVPVHAALWHRDGEIVVTDPDPVTGASGHWAFITREGGEGARVRAVTLGTLMKDLNIPSIDVAKIDIEGAELELFEDASWVNSVRCVMIELHDRFRPECAEAVRAALSDFERTGHRDTEFYLRKNPTLAIA